MRVRRAVVLAMAAGALGCGTTSRHPVPEPLPQAAGGATTGGSASGGSEEPTAGAAGDAALGVCERGANSPQADPLLTGRYRWRECGTIAANGRPRQALYAHDGSILIAEETGRLVAYGPEATSASILLAESGFRPLSMALSLEGQTLVAWDAAMARVYRAADDGVIGENSGALVEVSAWSLTEASCAGPLRLSPDAALAAAAGAERACVWDVKSGTLEASVPLTGQSLVALALGDAPLRVLRDGLLSRVTLTGEQRGSRRVAASEQAARSAAFSPDAETLLFVSGGELVAVDTASAAERWRRPIEGHFDALVFSSDGFVLAPADKVFRLSDGAELARDTASPNSNASALGPGGATKLMVGEQVGEWRLAERHLLRLYGAHTAEIRSLDVSRDGRYFASHGAQASVWEIAANFAESKPLFGGSFSTTRHVALAPEADAVVVAGDNAAYFRADGSYQGMPLSDSAQCPSATWSFSPTGDLVAGNWYGTLLVMKTGSFEPVSILGEASKSCGVGVAFSPDGARLMTSSLDAFDTRSFRLLLGEAAPSDTPLAGAVAYAPDCAEVVRTLCEPSGCSSARHDARTGELLAAVPELLGRRAFYSPEGHWLVSNERLVHLPSATSLTYAAETSAAIFTPDGDIIAGAPDGSLSRYCRTTP